MTDKKSDESGCRCEVESVIKVDERGQMVLPKEIREKLGVEPDSKLAVVSMEKDSEICCISLMKTEELDDVVKEKLEPLLEDL